MICLLFQAIGDNDFDFIDLLSSFIDEVDFPVLACNVNTTLEPLLHGKLQPSVVLDVGGEQVAIVGYMTTAVTAMVNPGIIKYAVPCTIWTVLQSYNIIICVTTQ